MPIISTHRSTVAKQNFAALKNTNDSSFSKTLIKPGSTYKKKKKMNNSFNNNNNNHDK